MISSYCQKSFIFIQNFCIKLNKCFRTSFKSNQYIQINANSNNEESKPAKILSSEELNEMINNQIKYNKEQANTNEYKIIKQKTYEDMPKTGELLNLEEIKNEINQIEFEEEEQKKKNKKENNIDNGITDENKEEEKNNEDNINNNEEENLEEDTKINIEELRKDVLESNDDDE
jgi:hypothetical protein